MLDDMNTRAIWIILLMIIQHGGDVLVRKENENSRCSVQPNELLVSTLTQLPVHNLKFLILISTNITFSRKHRKKTEDLVRAAAGHRSFLESTRNFLG